MNASNLPPTLPEPVEPSPRPVHSQTRPLPPLGFSELPRGAIVNNRFQVLQTLETRPHLNTYLALDESTGRECLLLESDDPHHYQAEKRLLEADVHHPALIEIYDVCHIQFGDHTRAYLAHEYPLTPLAPGNVRAMTVLQWGVQLADALVKLHSKDLVHGGILPEHLYLSNYQIKLGGFLNLTEFSLEGGMQDIVDLAQTLQTLMLPLERDSAFAPAIAQLIERACAREYRHARAFQIDLQQLLDDLRHPSKLTTVVGRLSDVGMRREIDEDALLTTEIVQFTQNGYQLIGLYAVADGMGGASAGEVASRMVTETLARYVAQNILSPHFALAPTDRDYADLLRAAIEQANADVLEARTRAQTDMGSTVVAALVVGNQAYIANVGDSRAYLITSEQITKLTKDHSLVQALADSGAIREEDVRTHPQRSYILRNIGDKPQIAVDLFQVQVDAGQSLLLCCDGLWEMVREEQIRDIVQRHTSPQDACRELIQVANQNGGDDNITCVLVRFERA